MDGHMVEDRVVAWIRHITKETPNQTISIMSPIAKTESFVLRLAHGATNGQRILDSSCLHNILFDIVGLSNLTMTLSFPFYHSQYIHYDESI